MKHILGYGVLVLALIGALVWGMGRCPQSPAPAPPAPVPAPPEKANFGPVGNSTFNIDLFTKSTNGDGNTHLTDHPADFAGKVTKFTWTYAAEPFRIHFKGVNPCTLQTDIQSVPTGNANVATCTLADPSNVGQFKYRVEKFSGGGHIIGPHTCSGCLIEVQATNDPDEN